jgi:amino acid adenylation domain-containing protein
VEANLDLPLADRDQIPTLYHAVWLRAMRLPESTALASGAERVSYRQLTHRIGVLARLLQAAGVGPETIVGVYLDDPAEKIVAVLAIWAAGGAYLPLDTGFPVPRTRSMLLEAQALVAVTQPNLVDELQAMAAGGLRVVTPADGGHDACSDWQPPAQSDTRNLAYVMYTSGSTGQPKAVAVEHESLLNYVRTALTTYVPLNERSIVLQLAAFTFDPWLRDAIMPLVQGGCVVLLAKPDRRDPERILLAMHEHGVTHVLGATPTIVAGLVSASSFAADPPSPALTLVSGESFLPLRAYDSQLQHLGTVVNHFGSTEVTLIATRHEVRLGAGMAGDAIGQPLPGVRVHLLSPGCQPISTGQPAEMFIGGHGVARGYLGAPGPTAERFLPDPFGPPGSRMYRTGDLASRGHDGTLYSHGRLDRQISLRGHRIEPAEVELAIATHPAVATAAVVQRDRSGQGPILAAYLAARNGASVDPRQLRRYLEERIPAHLIPAVFVALERMPVGPTGKIDYPALPPLPERPARSAAPMTRTQQQIAAVMADALGEPSIGPEDNFFELGGHSMLAARIAAALRSRLGRDVTTEHILRYPTVSTLSENLPAPAAGLEPVIRRRQTLRYPLSILQLGLFPREPRSGEYLLESGDTVARAYHLGGALDVSLIHGAIGQIINRHALLRARFTAAADGPPVQLLRSAMPVPFDVVDCTDGPPAGRADIAAARMVAEQGRTFDLTRLPLFRVLLFRLAPDSHFLLMVFHRLIADSASTDIFIRELSACYAAAQAGEPPALRPVQLQYPDFAKWQRETVRGKRLRQQVEYWQNQLGEPVQARPSGESAGGCGPIAFERFTVAPRILRSLHARARTRGAGLSELLETAFGISLARERGGQHAVFSTERRHLPLPDLALAIGPLTGSVGKRVDLSGGPAFSQLLSRAHADGLGAGGHPDVPIEYFTGCLGLGQPFLCARFVLHDTPPEPPRLNGVEVTAVELTQEPGPWLIRLEVTEQGGHLAGQLSYRPAPGAAAAARRLAASFTTLVSTVADGDCGIDLRA